VFFLLGARPGAPRWEAAGAAPAGQTGDGQAGGAWRWTASIPRFTSRMMSSMSW
jgi:hypothetical protein